MSFLIVSWAHIGTVEGLYCMYCVYSTRVSANSSELAPPPAPSPATECAPPLKTKGGEGITRLRARRRGANSYDWRESLTLCLLCDGDNVWERKAMPSNQCSGSGNIRNGFGSADPVTLNYGTGYRGGRLITDPTGSGSYLAILLPLKSDSKFDSFLFNIN
jgi:hypothetical protein